MDKILPEALKKFELFISPYGGIDSWLDPNVNLDPDSNKHNDVFVRLIQIDSENKPLSHAQLNQLMVLSHEAGMSAGFYKYFWCHIPKNDKQLYNTLNLESYDVAYDLRENIESISQLYFGMYRFYLDSLLVFGNTREAYRQLRTKTFDEIQELISSNRMQYIDKGPALELEKIPKDNRYLISEMACKSYAPAEGDIATLERYLVETFETMSRKDGKTNFTIKELIEGAADVSKAKDRQFEFELSACDFLEAEVKSIEEIKSNYKSRFDEFESARVKAIKNTKLYLSMVNDLDVYVATSMRNRDQFRDMGNRCDEIFQHKDLIDMNVRYFDPTLSAAKNHEDKGLIECLMVKSAKILIYMAGTGDSYGKDAEAAMALSLGKPVIFFCDEAKRERFYKEIHPLSRLINFKNGVATGAIVTSNILDVPKLVRCILDNTMEYRLEAKTQGYIQVKEVVTGSIVRVQTNDRLIRETFWNHYNNQVV